MAASVPADIKAYLFNEGKSKGEVGTYVAKPLAKTDADILVTYCGVCHSDVHMVDDDWKMSRYAVVSTVVCFAFFI